MTTTNSTQHKLDIKVAWLTPVLGVNGKLLYWEKLFNEYAKLFNKLTLFTLEFGGEWTMQHVDLQLCGEYKRLYKNERLVKTGNETYSSGISLSPPYVLKHLAVYKPDLIISSEFGLFTLYAIIYAKIIKRIPVLLLVEAEPRFKDKALLGLVRKYFRKFILFCVDAVITNNIQGQQYLLQKLAAPANKIIVRPYLLSRMADAGTRLPKKASTPKIRFIYVGNVSIRKGLSYLFKAFEKLLPEYKDRFICDVVGSGVDEDALKEQVQEAGLTENIVFHGRKEYGQLTELYEAADAFVFPSLGDYRALVTFEALSVGLPIIGSIHDGGSSEVVIENENGYIVDPRDLENLANKIKQLIQNPALVEKFSKKSVDLSSKYEFSNASYGLMEACELALDNFK